MSRDEHSFLGADRLSRHFKTAERRRDHVRKVKPIFRESVFEAKPVSKLTVMRIMTKSFRTYSNALNVAVSHQLVNPRPRASCYICLLNFGSNAPIWTERPRPVLLMCHQDPARVGFSNLIYQPLSFPHETQLASARLMIPSK